MEIANDKEYYATCDCKPKVPLTDEEKRQIVDYFKSVGYEISPNQIIENKN